MEIQGRKLAVAGTTALLSSPLVHFGGVGVIAGLGLALIAYHAVDDLENVTSGTLPALLPGSTQAAKQVASRLLVGKSQREARAQASMEDSPQDDIEAALEQAEQNKTALLPENDLFFVPSADDTGGIARLTIEQIVARTKRNSYTTWIGRSLTKAGNPAVMMNFYKQHIRFIGASQRGKSSMLAAFLDIVTRTHDPEHVRLILLDKENKTSKMFEHLPHVYRIRVGGQPVTMHARNEEEVLKYLMTTVMILRQRLEMDVDELLTLPILLVYIEEFLSLKNYFKAKVNQAKGKEAKEQATSDYASLVYSIEELAQLGLKARVQLLLCAQVEYADDDFKEAMASIGCGMSFCVKPEAAAAAGFMNRKLLNDNAKANKVGQAVVATPDCDDLVLSPDYPLEQRLHDLQRQQRATSQVVPERFPGGSEVVPTTTDNHSNGKQFPQGGKPSELDPAKLLAIRAMVRKHASQNEIVGDVFVGMRSADAIAEYRKYLAALIEG